MVVFFSGTGNSRYVAQRIAAAAGDELFDAFECIRRKKGASFTRTGVYVFVSPVYVSAPAMVFLDFLRRSRFPDGCRAFFVMTSAGGMGAAPYYCRKLAAEKGFAYLGTAEVKMPQNYIVFFRMGTPQENRARIESAFPVVDRIAGDVIGSRALDEHEPKLWELLAAKLVLRPYYRFCMSAGPFTATDRCVGCGKCAALCPLGNITLKERRPVWGDNCTHCMSCINLCPKDAIEYGRLTSGKPRYHGPEA